MEQESNAVLSRYRPLVYALSRGLSPDVSVLTDSCKTLDDYAAELSYVAVSSQRRYAATARDYPESRYVNASLRNAAKSQARELRVRRPARATQYNEVSTVPHNFNCWAATRDAERGVDATRAVEFLRGALPPDELRTLVDFAERGMFYADKKVGSPTGTLPVKRDRTAERRVKAIIEKARNLLAECDF